MTDIAGQGPLSTFTFSDLAMLSAVELEKARAKAPYDAAPLKKLADALTQTTRVAAPGAPFKFVDPGLYEPFERLYHARAETRADDIEQLQAFMSDKVRQLRAVQTRKPSAAKLQDLVSFCVALHRELIREMNSEDELVVREWRPSHVAAPPSLG